MLSFGTSAYNTHGNEAFPGPSGRFLIAPYWDDIDITNGGAISYELFESGYFLDEVNAFLFRKVPSDFEGTWMIVADYDKVAPFSGSGEVNVV